MIDLLINRDGDLLIWHFRDSVDSSQIEKYYHQIKSIIRKTTPGFTLITDLSELKSMDTECTDFIGASMDLINQAQVSRVYRVISNSEIDIGWNILAKFHYDMTRVQIQIMPTFYEAIRKFIVEKEGKLAPKNSLAS